MAKYSIDKDTFHYKWSKSHEPALTVKKGDSVTFEVNEVTTWQVSKKTKAEELTNIDWGKLYPLAGPVFVEGAHPGDALVVDIEQVKPASWAWSAILPGLGILEEFDKPFLHIWNVRAGQFLPYKKGIKVRQRPFCGVMGVAPPEEGYFDVLPPGKHGGNMDIRHLVAGTRILIPVWNEGALFSTGDVHAGQGDGEVCVTAIECAGEVKLTFDIKKNANLQSPCYYTSLRSEAKSPTKSRFVTTGIAPDLMVATKLAVRNMISQLEKETGLTREEAYILCSVAGDLRIHEVVDAPNWVVGFGLERDLARI